jgi:thioredoxin reductase (NADPH)
MLSEDELLNIPLFSTLGQNELNYLARTVPDIYVMPGEYVVHEGESRALIVVVAGKFEVTKVMDGLERVIANRLPGTLFGEVPIVLNSPFLASLRALEKSRVIRIEPKVYHTLAATAPEVSAKMGALALERIGGLQDLAKKPPPREVFLIGPRTLPAVQAIKNFLHRNQIEFEWLAPDDPAIESVAPGISPETAFPLVCLPGGICLFEPSIQEIAKNAGLSVAPALAVYDVVIIGGGPAGMAAAVYGASEGLRTLLVEREAPGGQAGTSAKIENYLGFPFGVSGDELSTRALQQARRLGAEIVVTRSVEKIDAASRTLTFDGGETIKARTIILATGVTWRQLEIESLDSLSGRGVFYGAGRSEAGAMQGRNIFMIGAGNSAGQAALFFSSYARSVTLVVRGDSLGKSMSHYLTAQLQGKQNINVALRSEVIAVYGSEYLEAIDIINHQDGSVRRQTAEGLFIFIGADAATDWLPAGIARDDKGYVRTGRDVLPTGLWKNDREPFLLETSFPGIFAAGDIRAGSVKRVASAVGDGSLAITLARQYMEMFEKDLPG